MTPEKQDFVAFERIGPLAPLSPLVLSVPHAGRHYPAALRAASAVPMHVLEELEDRHADRLVSRAVDDGAVAIVARIARAWIDLNRGEDDLDPTLHAGAAPGAASARARSGLGLVPRRIGRRDLWHTPPDARAVVTRVAEVHRPYHAAVARALDEARRSYGYAILLDCHSMPSIGGSGAARIVLGDRHGTTASAEIVRAMIACARHAGHRVGLNAPYAGAHGIARHGRPDDDIHAVQIEVDRALYLAPDRRTTIPRLAEIAELIAVMGRAAITAGAPPAALAAE